MRRRREDGPDFHNGEIDAALYNPNAKPQLSFWSRPRIAGPRSMTDAERKEFPPRVEVRRNPRIK